MKIGLIFLGWLIIFPVGADILEEVRWGMDIEENVSFANAEACNDVVRSVLQENGFIPKKTGYYEQGPTIFSVNKDNTQKSVVKCMLSYDLVITAVIGLKENLQKAEQLNDSIKNRQQSRSAPVIQQDNATQVELDNQKRPFTHFGQQQKIPAPRGHIVLASPTLESDVLNQIAQPSDIDAVGYIETEEGKFYISQYSWEQYKAGKNPNWVYIFPE